MNTLGPVRATGVTLLVPVTAVIWGVILLREVVTPPIIVGMVVILTGIVLTNIRARKPDQVTEKETAAARADCFRRMPRQCARPGTGFTRMSDARRRFTPT